MRELRHTACILPSSLTELPLGFAGRVSEPAIWTSFGEPAKAVDARAAQRTLDLHSFMGAGSNVSDVVEQSVCRSDLTCANAEAIAGSASLDVHGVVGTYCAHSIPLRGGWVNNYTPEQFLYYLLLLPHVLDFDPNVDIYVDFNCRLKVCGPLEREGRGGGLLLCCSPVCETHLHPHTLDSTGHVRQVAGTTAGRVGSQVPQGGVVRQRCTLSAAQWESRLKSKCPSLSLPVQARFYVNWMHG